jgi:hypothetical protein
MSAALTRPIYKSISWNLYLPDVPRKRVSKEEMYLGQNHPVKRCAVLIAFSVVEGILAACARAIPDRAARTPSATTAH